MLSDPRLIHNINMLVWRLVLHLCILPRRGKTSAERYRKIWTEEKAVSMEEIASASQTLAQLAQDLQKGVGRFHV